MLKIALESLGCSKNLVDAEIMMGILNRKGYKLVGDFEEADIILVNTCGFIESAKQESIDTILDLAQLKETGNLKLLIVTGCLAQRYANELKEDKSTIRNGTEIVCAKEEALLNEICNASTEFMQHFIWTHTMFMSSSQMINVASPCPTSIKWTSIWESDITTSSSTTEKTSSTSGYISHPERQNVPIKTISKRFIF
jgi:tRNA A37 methylthiotransferase MiaB